MMDATDQDAGFVERAPAEPSAEPPAQPPMSQPRLSMGTMICYANFQLSSTALITTLQAHSPPALDASSDRCGRCCLLCCPSYQYG